MKRSLRVSLTLLLMALSLIPALAVGIALGWGMFLQERARSLQFQRQIIDQASGQITTYLQSVESELNALIQSPELRAADRATQEAVLSRALFYRDTFDEIEFVLPDGAVTAYVSRLGTRAEEVAQSHAGEAIILEPLRTGKTFFEGFRVSPVNQETLLLMSVPAMNVAQGVPEGVLIAKVRMRKVFDQVTSLPLGRRGVVFVADENGTVVAHPALASASWDNPTLLPGLDGVGPGLREGTVLQTRRAITLGNIGLTIGAELPLVEADEQLRSALLTAGLLLLCIVAATAALCVLAVNRIVAPIRALATTARQISAGDLTQQVVVTRHDEVGALQQDFNQMVTDLRTERAALEQRTSELQSSLDRQRSLVETVAQLSSPLLPVWNGVVVLPIIGGVDAQRGEALTSALVQGVAARRARVAIIDITGLAGVDEAVLTTLARAAQAAELLGAHAMLAGVSSTVASRIIKSGIDLGRLESFRDLQSATEAAIARIDEPITTVRR